MSDDKICKEVIEDMVERNRRVEAEQIRGLITYYADIANAATDKCKQLQAELEKLKVENKRLKNCVSITLSEIENRLAGIDFEMIERRFEQALKGE